MTARIRRSTALLGSKPKQKIDFFKIKEIKLISLNFTTTYPNQKLLLFIISNFQSNNQDFFCIPAIIQFIYSVWPMGSVQEK